MDGFKWVEDTSQFHEDYIESYSEDSDVEYFLKLMFNILKHCMNFMIIYFFFLKELKLKKLKKLNAVFRKNMEKVRKHRDIKLVKTKTTMNY